MSKLPPFRRFHDLCASSVNVDFQVHTVKTDGKGTIREILSIARERKLGAIAFTEHVRKSTDWFAGFAEDVRRTAEDFREISVYVGCETKALDKAGTLDVSAEIFQISDIVLGSVHRFPDDRGGYLEFNSMSPAEMAELEFELALGMAEKGEIDVLSHPGGMYERRHGAFPEKYFRDLMRATLKAEVAIEINSSYLVDPENFLRLCAEIDPFVSIGSDVHSLDEIGRCRDMLRKRGIGEK